MKKTSIVEIGKLPPPGEVPEFMYAQVIRKERYGNPATAFQIEKIKVPEIAEDEALVAIMAAGLNFNSVWAARGYPLDVISYRKKRGEGNEDFQIAGSDASGIVYKIGAKVSQVKVGDPVILSSGIADYTDPFIKAGGDSMLSGTFRVSGYETNWGSFAQFCIAKEYNCFKKPTHLSWEEAAVYNLSASTAYRMLHHYTPHNVRKGDVVLIWGGGGGLGVMAIQLSKLAGAFPVAVVSSEEKRKVCEQLGALTVNRLEFDHWGPLTRDEVTEVNQLGWGLKARKFKKIVKRITGGKLPRIVIEHPGEYTLPTSLVVCENGGMVVTCAGTSGYLGTFDLRQLWLYKKRIQGSHGANLEEIAAVNKLFYEDKMSPVLKSSFAFHQLPEAMQIMYENKHSPGKTAIRIGVNKQ